MKYQLFSFLLLVLTLISCNQKDGYSQEKQTDNKTININPIPKPTPGSPYPPLPESIIRDLFDRCDFVDYVFYDWDFSVSISDEQNAKASLHNVGAVPPSRLTCEKSIGRATFIGEGDIIIEAEIYFEPNKCTYFIFSQDGQPTYAGLFTQRGLTFFNQLWERNQKQRQVTQPTSNGQ